MEVETEYEMCTIQLKLETNKHHVHGHCRNGL